MGVKAFLQKGRGKPGLVLPANAVAKVNQASDRSALVRVAEYQEKLKDQVRASVAVPAELLEPMEPMPNIGMSIAAKASGSLTFETQAEVVPEPDPMPAEERLDMVGVPPEPKPKLADDDLTQIQGIGPALQRRLHNFGFRTVTELAAADPNVLNEVQGAKGRGELWVEEARKLVTDT